MEVVRMNTRFLLLPIVVLLFSGCGEERHPNQTWPASLATLRGFSSTQGAQVSKALEKLNELTEQPVISLSDNRGGYPISIELRDLGFEIGQRVGHAQFTERECVISLSPLLFSQSNSASPIQILPANAESELPQDDLLTAVTCHEMGHCAGLPHSQDKDALMYPITLRLNRYSTVALQQFAKDFLKAIGKR